MIDMGIVPTLAAIVLAAVQVWQLSRRRKTLWWTSIRSTKMMDISPEVAKNVQIRYRQKPISGSLIRFTFVVHYTGNSPLNKSTIHTPLTWTTDARVVDAWQAISDPASFKLEVSHSEHSVTMRWNLMNPGWRAVIGVLCETSDPINYGIIDGEIERKEHVQPNAYCPYGLGPHTCLGATTADLLYLVISAVLFRHFHVAMQPPDQALHIVMNPLPAPDDRFRISVTGERCPPPRSPGQAPAS